MVCTLVACMGGVGGGPMQGVFFHLVVVGAMVLGLLWMICNGTGVPGNVEAHSQKTSWRALIAYSCVSHISVGESSSVHVSFCSPWRKRSSGVSIGWFKYW